MKKNFKNIIFRIIILVLLALWSIFILNNSFQSADTSSGRSIAFVEFFRGLFSEHFIRKMAHFVEFAIEGILLENFVKANFGNSLKNFSWSMIFGILFSLTDETVQLFSTGRSSQVTDVWLDSIGYMVGFLLAMVLSLLYNKTRNKKLTE